MDRCRKDRLRHILVSILFVAVAATSLAFASVASAAIEYVGVGKGVEVPQGEGIYALHGSWTDTATGAQGSYTGTLVNSGDYTTCLAIIGCEQTSPLRQCNIAGGEITFRTAGKSFTVGIADVVPFNAFFPAFVCLDPSDASKHRLGFGLFNASPPPFSDGYGDIFFALGGLSGTSAQAGASGVFLDEFTFNVSLR